MISFPAIDAGSHPQQNKMVYCKLYKLLVRIIQPQLLK
jgi:hypothetical protein